MDKHKHHWEEHYCDCDMCDYQGEEICECGYLRDLEGELHKI